MPQKSTFFYPKLTSGLLLLPGLSSSRLARAVPRGRRRREGRARGDADARGARAADRPRQGRRHHRGDRRGGRDARCSRTSTAPDIRIVSEEIGIRGEGALTVVVDPIDGSQNAERAIPYFALSVAVAEGETMDDVVFGFVYDFGADEEWTAVRGGGAFLNGDAARRDGRRTSSSSSRSRRPAPSSSLDRLRTLAPLTDRIRIMGAQAITFCHLAAGRTDGVVCPQALPPGRLRRRAAARPRARVRDPGDRRARARLDPARPRGPLADRRRRHRGAGVADRGGGTLLARWNPLATPFSPRSANVIDPELRKPVTELDMVRDVDDRGGDVAVTIALTVVGCPLRNSFQEQVAREVGAVEGVTSVKLEFDVMSPTSGPRSRRSSAAAGPPTTRRSSSTRRRA